MTKKPIPNPNKISVSEKEFLGDFLSKDQDSISDKDNYKGRMISMSDSFFNRLNNYIRKNPTEGNRSSFIVRVVAEYIDKKENP